MLKVKKFTRAPMTRLAEKCNASTEKRKNKKNKILRGLTQKLKIHQKL
jgi:hypothetical protein